MREVRFATKIGTLLLISACALLISCGDATIVEPPTTAIAATKHPLVAQYSFTSRCKGQVRVNFGPDTSYGRSTAWYPTLGFASKLNILVAGMRASTTYHLSSEFQCNGTTWNSPDQTFKTGPLPSSAWPSLTVARPNSSLRSNENGGVELLDLIDFTGSGIMQALVTDRDGRPIWYYDVGNNQGYWPYTFKFLPNGHAIFSITKEETGGTILREVDLAGNTVQELNVNVLAQRMQQAGFNFQITGYHHDLLPLANGHLIVLGSFYKDFTDLPGHPGTTAVLGDGIVDLDPNWQPVWAWSAFDHLDVNRHLNGLPDWTHSNALIYSASDGNLILSMRHQSWIIKIDYKDGSGTGDILWKLGYQGDYVLPSDDPSQWFSFQHYPWIVSQDGSKTTLAVWDNGDARVEDSAGHVCGSSAAVPNCYSRAQIYEIDEQTRTALLLWQDLPGLFSLWGGSISQLANGNVEFDANSPLGAPFASQVQEVTQEASPHIIWEMTIGLPTYAYRAHRIPSLYPDVSWSY